ncbi:hypothetical protein Tco_0570990 [Tanacetum coccineum]
MYALAHSRVKNKQEVWESVKSRYEEEGLINLNISQCTALTPPAVQALCDSFPALHTTSYIDNVFASRSLIHGQVVGGERTVSVVDMDNVLVYVEKNGKRNEGTIRGYDTMVVKWKHSIRPKIAAFSVVCDSVQRMDESGSSNLALFQKALAKFETQYGHLFTMEACRRILKNHPAWTVIEMSSFNRRHNSEV